MKCEETYYSYSASLLFLVMLKGAITVEGKGDLILSVDHGIPINYRYYVR